jgi:hypothetical protein
MSCKLPSAMRAEIWRRSTSAMDNHRRKTSGGTVKTQQVHWPDEVVFMPAAPRVCTVAPVEQRGRADPGGSPYEPSEESHHHRKWPSFTETISSNTWALVLRSSSPSLSPCGASRCARLGDVSMRVSLLHD